MAVPLLILAFAYLTEFGAGDIGAAGARSGQPVAQVGTVAAGWQAREADNIVGLRDPRTLSNPVRVDYEDLLERTEEMKRIKRERIDPASPQGVQLKNRARQRVADACQQVMTERGYCSVWKQISHSDGRTVNNATDAVAQLL